ncbi:hypothetical protein ACLOJK_014416 [Asimina triloba]
MPGSCQREVWGYTNNIGALIRTIASKSIVVQMYNLENWELPTKEQYGGIFTSYCS